VSTKVFNVLDKKYFDAGCPEDPETPLNRTEVFGSKSLPGFEKQDGDTGCQASKGLRV
jgi:hypothetical protein